MLNENNEDQITPNKPRLIWGMKAIGAEIGLGPGKVYHLIRNGRIKTARVGRLHVTTDAQILADLLTFKK